MEIGTEPTIPITPALEKNFRVQNEMEDSKSGCKTPDPDEKKGESQRILVPRNGSMDRSKLKVPKSPNLASKVKVECKTPTPVKETGKRLQFGGIELPKNGTPNLLKVPKALKYPERYKSPTDLMISPISKGLLARSRKGAVPSKMHELRIEEMSLQG